ncbi:MAG: DUF4006 domain-containing protein [Sulfurovum sp.]|nr:MAG: DUF4006 domain-containing protein [Sulfurovum sp.]
MAATENTSRSVFGLNGVTGMLIATVLLLSILAFLVTKAIEVQRTSAVKPYDPAPIVSNLDNVKAKSKANAQFAFKDAK